MTAMGMEQLERDLTSTGFVRTERPAFLRALSPGELQGIRKDLWFFGNIKTARSTVPAYLYVPDLNFVISPAVLIPERPAWLTGWRPHLRELDSTGVEELCFSDHEKFQLLAHMPGPALLRVIEDARQTLDRIAEPTSILEDSKRELHRLWQPAHTVDEVYLDVPFSEHTMHCKSLLHTNPAGVRKLFVGQNPAALAAKLGVLNQLSANHDAMIYPHQNHEDLYLTSVGPPGNLLAFANWLKQVSPAAYSLWHAQMQLSSHYKSRVAYHFFASSKQYLGYFVDLPRTARRVHSAKEIRAFLGNYVYQDPLPITRLSAHRMDEDYLVRRNLEAEVPDLRGLQVLLVGAGAIGGFIAQNLLQLGAGGRGAPKSLAVKTAKVFDQAGKRSTKRSPLLPVGSIGMLHICDRDLLSGENVGRHVLGTQDVGKSKADALCAHLQRLRPGVSVRPIATEFQSLESELERYDVIIDATGYETFGRYVSKTVRAAGWLKPPHFLLHVWLEGRGGVVRCLAQDKVSCACYDCMWNYTAGTEPRPRHPAYSDAKLNAHGDDGYATMTPFSVSAPMAAAALATDALMSWRAGNAAPRFRSRSSEGAGIHPSVAKDLSRAKSCPGCSS